MDGSGDLPSGDPALGTASAGGYGAGTRVTRSRRGIYSGNPGHAGPYRQEDVFGRHSGRAHLAKRTSGMGSSVAPSQMLSWRLTPPRGDAGRRHASSCTAGIGDKVPPHASTRSSGTAVVQAMAGAAPRPAAMGNAAWQTVKKRRCNQLGRQASSMWSAYQTRPMSTVNLHADHWTALPPRRRYLTGRRCRITVVCGI